MLYRPQHGACISSAKLLAGLFFESQACLTGTAPGETNKTLLPWTKCQKYSYDWWKYKIWWQSNFCNESNFC